MAIVISILALLATFYQLYLQRAHNEKSLKPLGQIELPDHSRQLAVYVRNNGLGPLIIDQLIFTRDGRRYSTIDECLDLDPKSYMRMIINDAVKRVVLPNAYLVVFETNFDDSDSDPDIEHVRKQLAAITLNVEFRDIYDNKMTIERDFRWFSRYMQEEAIEL